MPVHEQEEAFVKRFIIEKKQQRYLHFLAQVKTREKFLHELYHSLAFKTSLGIEIPSKDQYPDLVEHRLKMLGAKTQAYVISTRPWLDQQWRPLTDALTEIVNSELESIVCCLPGQLAFYQAEDSAYILHYPRVT